MTGTHRHWFWTDADLDRLREVYEAEGLEAAEREFPRRSNTAVQAMVKKMRLRPPGPNRLRSPAPPPRSAVPEGATTFADLLARMNTPIVPVEHLTEALQVLKVLREFIGRQQASALEGLDRPDVRQALMRASQLIDGSRGVAVAGSPLGQERVPTRGHPAAATTRVAK